MDHRHLTLHEGYLYFAGSGQSCSFGSEGSSCTGGGIHRIALDGGEPEQVLDAVAVSNVVSNARGVYWFASSPPRVMFAERGGAEREVANVLNEGIGINGIATLRADADALYWSADDTVLRLPFDSEQVTRLVTELDGASDVAVRGDWVYEAESVGGRILRVATDGSANAPLGPITGPVPHRSVAPLSWRSRRGQIPTWSCWRSASTPVTSRPTRPPMSEWLRTSPPFVRSSQSSRTSATSVRRARAASRSCSRIKARSRSPLGNTRPGTA